MANITKNLMGHTLRRRGADIKMGLDVIQTQGKVLCEMEGHEIRRIPSTKWLIKR